MNTIKHVLLKGNESFLDHTKSIALYGKLYWRKSDKKLNVGDIVYLFMSGKGHYPGSSDISSDATVMQGIES